MNEARLTKELGLFDVYAISTGAMFSSGFFLLPGLAAAQSGPSVILAYLAAAAFILPSMLSVAELATAMPRAGGAYYFLDRALGPLVGTVGGVGAWLGLVFKSAFALVGMGAYLVLFVEAPMTATAVALTVAFGVLNIAGAKETTGLQRVLVVALVAILAFFLMQGTFEVAGMEAADLQARTRPLFPFGAAGFLSTIGLVFVSYAGLTKVASVAEEVRDPDRNIPLGMFLSLLTASVVYVGGVGIMVAVLEPDVLRSDLTPVATAATAFFDWLPGSIGLWLIGIAAIAAFASTGNAGILAASRYPFAMARDGLVWQGWSQLGRFGTPTRAIVATSAAMVLAILFLDVEGIAKLASAFQLLLFALLNFAVIVMRGSGIGAYDPGFRSPLYPWMQLFGMLGSLWLITEMGELAVLFSLGVVALGVGWYVYYVRGRVEREGALYHAFARLGERRHDAVAAELRSIMRERGPRPQDPFAQLVRDATVLELPEAASFRAAAGKAARSLAERVDTTPEALRRGFVAEARDGGVAVANGVALPHLRARGAENPELVVVRARGGVRIPSGARGSDDGGDRIAYALLFLVSPEDRPGQHLRILGHLARLVREDAFARRWAEAEDEEALRAVLLGSEASYRSIHR